MSIPGLQDAIVLLDFLENKVCNPILNGLKPTVQLLNDIEGTLNVNNAKIEEQAKDIKEKQNRLDDLDTMILNQEVASTNNINKLTDEYAQKELDLDIEYKKNKKANEDLIAIQGLSIEKNGKEIESQLNDLNSINEKIAIARKELQVAQDNYNNFLQGLNEKKPTA